MHRFMAHILETEGVPAAMILIEARSRNTRESALYTAQILRGRGIGTVVLVAEADSMLRIELSFRKQSIAVAPAPFRRTQLQFSLLPGWAALRRNERALHEYLGLAWYKLHGWV